MKSSFSSLTANKQETYIRSRDSPFFSGMRRGEAKVTNKESLSDIHGKLAPKSIFRSASDISDRRLRKGSLGASSFSPLMDSPDIVLEPVGQSSSGRWSKTSSPLSELKLDSLVNSEYREEFSDLSSPRVSKANVENLRVPSGEKIDKSYSWNERRTSLSNVPLPPSAALFYMGHSPMVEVIESSGSMCKLNEYLKTKKEELKAGVPGRFLHAVVGPDVSDLGSVAATIMYAYYLDESMQSDEFCTVPIINLKREEINTRAELKWILEQCHIDQSSLVFIDESETIQKILLPGGIDLSYYNLFGSLKLVLLNSNKLPSHQEDLHDALVEIFHCRKKNNAYPWVENITVAQDISCCTVVAEKFALTSPEVLVIKGVSRLLLAGILLDTGNLSNPQSTEKDKYMSTLLIHGAGRYGCNGLYQILRYKMYDVTELKVQDILQKNFRKWSKLGRNISC
ncbi:hypothetical protein Leryth_024278 [Lithospermum erythrorhizon]|nr:hypothetical protein Leryth_024278 [Lithospermum erythrorhizon]